MAKAYLADRIFTGEEWLHFYAVVIEDGMIQKLIPASCLPAGIDKEEFPECLIAPAFIDIQIYGAYGKLLAAHPGVEALNLLKEYCESGGAAYCLPTVATNPIQVVKSCIDAVRAYWQQGGRGILGLHLEGPWLNVVKRGAHIEELIHSPTRTEVEDLLAYGKDVISMITLAPEVCSQEIIDLILSQGIVISAGHSNISYHDALASFDKGVTAVTHLFNAMSPLQHRSPGLVGAAMNHPTVRASIIPDGHHVDFAAIHIAKQVMNDRLFVITDAVTETREGYYQHYPAGDKYESAGILSGSALNMSQALKNLVEFAGIDLDEALRMCSLYPAKVLKKDQQIGWIKKGFPAAMVVLDDLLSVKKLIAD